MSDTFTKLTYQTFQHSKSFFSLTYQALTKELRDLLLPTLRQKTKPVPNELFLKVQERLNHLLETDWQDTEKGMYPKKITTAQWTTPCPSI
ncbi:hypothetical protein JYQ62_34555 [Nostoc sp. UHCC 0702]|nr:hypothetical protein JYQ62_34555 [Nostoc sp. UHCC 0702]